MNYLLMGLLLTSSVYASPDPYHDLCKGAGNITEKAVLARYAGATLDEALTMAKGYGFMTSSIKFAYVIPMEQGEEAIQKSAKAASIATYRICMSKLAENPLAMFEE